MISNKSGRFLFLALFLCFYCNNFIYSMQRFTRSKGIQQSYEGYKNTLFELYGNNYDKIRNHLKLRVKEINELYTSFNNSKKEFGELLEGQLSQYCLQEGKGDLQEELNELINKVRRLF